jgi:hypothetical protein
MSEMEGKSIPYTHQQQSANNEERSKTIDCLVWKMDIEKKEFFRHFIFRLNWKKKRKKIKSEVHFYLGQKVKWIFYLSLSLLLFLAFIKWKRLSG